MKAKKTAAVLCALAVTLSALPGCGTAAPDTVGEQSAATGDAPSAEKTTLRIFGPNNVEEFPAGEDENNNKIIAYMEEKTGYDLIWEIAPKENAREKVNLMLTSGVECPDMIVNGDRNWGLDFVKEGMLHPLDDYVANTKNLKGLLTEEANRMMTFGDKLYGIVVPQNQDASNGVIIRKDWLEEEQLEVPRTLEEFRAALEAFKARRPDSIPFTAIAGTVGLEGLTSFLGAFGLAVQWREAPDGKLENSYITQDMKDFLAYMSGLYADGLLDKEYVVNKVDQRNEKIVSGRAGMASMGWADMKNLREGLAEKDKNSALAYAMPVGPDGRTGAAMNGPARIYFYIPVHSKQPDKAVDFLDKYVEEDVRKVVSYGWENEHYTVDKDNIIVATDKAEDIRYRIYYQLWDSREDFLNRVKLKGFWPDYEPLIPFATVEDPMWYAPLIPALQDNKTALEDIQAQYFIKFITGALPLTKFDEFVQQWKSQGGDAVTEAVNAWYADSQK